MVNSESLWLREAVLKYISKNNGTLDSVDVVDYFKLRADITLNEVASLIESGEIERTWTGRRYVYHKL